MPLRVLVSKYKMMAPEEQYSFSSACVCKTKCTHTNTDIFRKEESLTKSHYLEIEIISLHFQHFAYLSFTSLFVLHKTFITILYCISTNSFLIFIYFNLWKCVCIGVYVCVPHAYRSLGRSEEIMNPLGPEL